MDFRLRSSLIKKLLEEKGYEEGNYDLVSLAGSIKDLISKKEAEAEFVLKQISLSEKLHKIEEILILGHDNCGAYGISDPAEEEEMQKADLNQIKNKIGKYFPNLKTKAWIIKNTASGDLSLVEVF